MRPTRIRRVVELAVLLFACAHCDATPKPTVATSASTLAAHGATISPDAEAPTFVPKRGINLSSWLANAKRQPLFPRDTAQIKAAGFDYVRIPVNPDVFAPSLDSPPNALTFAPVDRAVDMAIGAGLAVILDLHPGRAFMAALENSDASETAFVEWWKALVNRYGWHSPSQIAFELLNEPQYYADSIRYNRLIVRTVSELRRLVPWHTLIVGGTRGSSIDGLLTMSVLEDPRVLYVFHFYEPYIVTHQGINQGFDGKAIPFFRDVPYPSRLAQLDKNYAPTASNASEARDELHAYVSADWDAPTSRRASRRRRLGPEHTACALRVPSSAFCAITSTRRLDIAGFVTCGRRSRPTILRGIYGTTPTCSASLPLSATRGSIPWTDPFDLWIRREAREDSRLQPSTRYFTSDDRIAWRCRGFIPGLRRLPTAWARESRPSPAN